MKKTVIILFMFSLCSLYAKSELHKNKIIKKDYFINFNDYTKSKLKSSWNMISKWNIVSKDNNKYLSMSKSNNDFNLCFMKNVRLKDGIISVRFKAISGLIDQGGGIMWRVVDEDNYYVARYNPLEDNFRFYSVIDGYRKQIKSSYVKLSNNKWHIMKIEQKGNHMKAYLDNKKLLDVIDNSMVAIGSVGLWSKADARTYFDDFRVIFKK